MCQNKVDPDGFEFYLPVNNAATPMLAVNADLASHKLLCVVTASIIGGTVQLYADSV